MVLAFEIAFLMALLLGIWTLTAGTRRFNISSRAMMITFAVTALSWVGFLVTTIALLVFATISTV